MVDGALSIGGFAGVVLSAAYLYWEVGRYAAPQVPQSLFDERKLFFGYAAGLFVGIPIAFVYLLFVTAITVFASFLSAVIDLAILVAAAEVAQWLLARSAYFGRSEATPFYAVAFRAAVGGILVLAIVARYLGGTSLDAEGLAATLALSLAVLVIQVTGALQSIRRSAFAKNAPGGPLSGAVVSTAAFAVLGLGISLGNLTMLAASLLIVGGLVPSYRRLRRRVLGTIEAAAGFGPTPEDPDRPFGRRPGD
jgi:hypothetical protein